MEIKVRINKVKVWLKEKLKRKLTVKQRLDRIENTVIDLVKYGMQQEGFDRQNRVDMFESIKNRLKDEFNLLLDKEKKNRLNQAKEIERKMSEKSKKMIDGYHVIIDSIKNRTNVIFEQYNEANAYHRKLEVREAGLEGLMSTLRKKITEIESYLDKIKVLENLADSAKNAYNMYLDDLKKEISKVKKTHAIPRRIASIEERITLLEISHNGSGEKTSGTVRTY